MMLLDSTDGSEIIWSKGDSGEQWAPDLYSVIPGASAPTLIFRDPNRNAQLNTIAVHNGKYAFEELFTNQDGTSGWRLWLAQAKGTPVVLDSNSHDPQGLPVPAIDAALTDDQVVWDAVHVVDGQEIWSLQSFDFKAKTTRTLISAPDSKTEFWFPNADDRGRLVYSTVEYGPDRQAATAAYHVYIADLSDNPLKPRKLDTDALAAEPVLAGDGDTVVWKTVSPQMSVATWGQLIRYSLATAKTQQMFFDDQSNLDYQSAGNRYVAGWEWNDTSFNLYDLQTNESLWIEKHEPTGSIGAHNAVVARDMLVFVRGDDSKPGGQNKWLCYAKLPHRG